MLETRDRALDRNILLDPRGVHVGFSVCKYTRVCVCTWTNLPAHRITRVRFFGLSADFLAEPRTGASIRGVYVFTYTPKSNTMLAQVPEMCD